MFGTTVANITRGLTDMVKQLEAHAKTMLAKEKKHLARAHEEQKKAHEAELEVIKARKVADKIGALLVD